MIIMSDENEAPADQAGIETDSAPVQILKKKSLKGFASMAAGMLSSVNDNDQFKEFYRDVTMQVLLVATDYYPAALIKIDHGKLEVEDVAKDDVSKAKKDALLQGTMQQIIDIAMRKLDPVDAWLHRKIKVRGPRKLLVFRRVFKYLKLKLVYI
jgi:putative sterol carrier protein